ncbi:MAG: hypothetical protein ACTHJ4_05910, partial [Candidatus Nucleicultricaceae bacterium]
MKKIFTLTVSIALLCFTSVSFAGRIGLTLELTDGQVDAPHIQQRHQAIMPPPQAPVQDEPQNDGRNFYLQIGATLTKAVIHQGCYVLGMLTDDLTTQRGSLLCIGIMASLANAIYNFDESDSLFRQDVLSACAGVLAGGLFGGLVGVSLNLPTEERN